MPLISRCNASLIYNKTLLCQCNQTIPSILNPHQTNGEPIHSPLQQVLLTRQRTRALTMLQLRSRRWTATPILASAAPSSYRAPSTSNPAIPIHIRAPIRNAISIAQGRRRARPYGATRHLQRSILISTRVTAITRHRSLMMSRLRIHLKVAIHIR